MHGTNALVLGLIMTSGALGMASWNSGGRRVVLIAAMLLSAYLSRAFWPFGGLVRYLSLAGFLLLLVPLLATNGRAIWPKLRLELLIAAGAMLAILISVVVSGRQARVVLATLALVLAAALIGVSWMRILRMFVIPLLRARNE